VYHGAGADIGKVPFPVDLFLKRDGGFRTIPDAYTTSFAGNLLNTIGRRYRIKPAQIPAYTAFGTLPIIDLCHVSAGEFLSLSCNRLENEMQIRRIDIAVRDNDVFPQSGEGTDQTRFSRPAFTAYDNQFFHSATTV
jgi:hypothetical protein